MDSIKNCPFCGGEVELIIPRAWEYRAYIICKAPACLGMMKIEWCSAEESEEMLTLLVDSWNRRTPEWIPVEESPPDVEYPKRSKNYFCAYDDGTVRITPYSRYANGHYWMWMNGFHHAKGITHWMPMPEPPEGWKEGER